VTGIWDEREDASAGNALNDQPVSFGVAALLNVVALSGGGELTLTAPPPHTTGRAVPHPVAQTLEALGRTVWEKMTAIHVFCLQGNIKDQLSRHWHDVAKLDVAGHVDDALKTRDIAQRVASHKSWFFAAKDSQDNVINYVSAVSGGLVLVPQGTTFEALAADYAKMVEDRLFLREPEPFLWIIERCQRRAAGSSNFEQRTAAIIEGLPGKESIGAPGEIARRCAPRPFGTAVALRRRPTWPAAKLSNSACLSAGSSNHDTELSEPANGFQARNIMVRPERFELPASWFVARRSIQLSYGRKG
jgi:hypothetical protein